MPKLGMEVIRRRQVIDAVIKILETQGWKDLTIREVSDVAGVSAGIITHYFGNKRTMTIDAIAEAHHRFDRRLQEIERRRMPPLERLRAAVAFAAGQEDGQIPQQAFWVAIWGRMPFDKLIQAEMRKLHQRYLEFLRAVIDTGVAQGVFTSRGPEDVAEQFIALAQGLGLAAETDPGAMHGERRRDLLTGLLERELGFRFAPVPQTVVAMQR